jgi:hypothetical protein
MNALRALGVDATKIHDVTMQILAGPTGGPNHPIATPSLSGKARSRSVDE